MEGKKLNLKWVTEVIGEDYKNWKKGDVVRVQAQTGTGKTLMVTGNDKIKGLIDRMEGYQRLIYICNRVELKRQIKLDLLKKYNLEIPKINNKLDIDTLDKMTRINNIVITSYHSIAYSMLANTYNSEDNNLDMFDYIVCDEMHFMLADSSFNNHTRLAFNELITKADRNAIKIFISATMDEMVKVIEKAVEDSKNSFIKKNDLKLHTYNTGIDYSYLNTKYFRHIKDIITLIKNDKTDDKWLVFVTSKKNGQDMKNELDECNISNDFITSGSKTVEAKNITSESKFNCKVLISTKALDNGVNIKDDKVKNLVVMAFDKTTFIQEIGRVRFNILNAPTINLYIRTCYKKTFTNLVDRIYNPKFQDCELYMKDRSKFDRKYHNNLSSLADDLFYIDNDTKDITLNKMGYVRLIKDGAFAKIMIEKFENEGEFAFIKEQLLWLGLEDTFNKDNLIEDVTKEDNIDTLKGFLKDAYSEKKYFYKEKFIEDIMKIINNDENLKVLFNKISGNGNRAKGAKMFNKLFTSNKVNLDYVVCTEKKTINGERKNYWFVQCTL